MNLTLKKIVNVSLGLILLDMLLVKGLEILGKDLPSFRRLRIISRKLKGYK